MKKHSLTGRLFALLLAAATLLTLVPAAMLSVSADAYPYRIEELDAAALTVEAADEPNTILASVNTEVLDLENYDYYYLALTGDEQFAADNAADSAAMIGHSVANYRIETDNYDRLDLADPVVETVIPSAEENAVFFILCAVAKDADGYVPVYAMAWGSCSMTWIDTFELPAVIEEADSDIISIVTDAEAGTALVTFDTDRLDYLHYDYYYLSMAESKDVVIANVADCKTIAGSYIGRYRIDTRAYNALPADFAGETLALEEGYENVFVVLAAVSKGTVGSEENVYVIAWNATGVAADAKWVYGQKVSYGVAYVRKLPVFVEDAKSAYVEPMEYTADIDITVNVPRFDKFTLFRVLLLDADGKVIAYSADKKADTDIVINHLAYAGTKNGAVSYMLTVTLCGSEADAAAAFEALSGTVAEPATEPETEPETEPATEPATEPETEPATEPETEPETEPATEPEVEPAEGWVYGQKVSYGVAYVRENPVFVEDAKHAYTEAAEYTLDADITVNIPKFDKFTMFRVLLLDADGNVIAYSADLKADTDVVINHRAYAGTKNGAVSYMLTVTLCGNEADAAAAFELVSGGLVIK